MDGSGHPPSRHSFEIAIICALRLERDAIEALLDEDYERDGHSYGKAAGDQNVYTIGRLGKQHVVVVHMPSMGTTRAAAVTTSLTSSFNNIRVAFVVGVCGGVPAGADGHGDDISLGDVIVSTSVVQIDFGRQYPDGFKRKKEAEDMMVHASPEIRAFVQKLSGRHSRNILTAKTSLYSSQISLREGFSDSSYPGSQYDIQYAAQYRHKHWNQNCQICDRCIQIDDEVCEAAVNSSCDSLGCQGVALTNRGQQRPAVGHQLTDTDLQEVRKPTVHFGRIACGNQVMKSGIHRDLIAFKENVIGFEMESAGTWDYVPTIVVKSVCDYADSHKNKRWQGYAAATAAACTKAILEEWRSADRQAPSSASQPIFPRHYTVPRSTNKLFTGRHDVLNELKSIIREAVENRPRETPCHIVISGMGGQGKSEICLQLTHQLRGAFWGIFWVDVSTPTQAQNHFLDIARRLGVTVSTWETARQELANAEQPWLLVLDNADDPDFDYQVYFPAGTFGVVILTSRNAECEQFATAKWIDLEGLAPADAQELLFLTARVTLSQRERLLAHVCFVAELLQSHPLALLQAGSYIRRGHCSFEDYPRIYEQQRKRLLAFRPVQAVSRYRDVYTTFEASAQTLQQSETETASDALQLLPLLAMYGPNRLPVLLFETAWQQAQLVSPGKIVEADDLRTLTPWFLAHLPALLQMETSEWNSFRLIEALNLLKAFSLISVNGEGSSMNISMHPLVHAWARDRLSPKDHHSFWVQAGCLIATLGWTHSLWVSHARQLQPHLQAITSAEIGLMFSTDPKIEICRILMRCGTTLDRLRDDKVVFMLLSDLCTYLSLDNHVVTSQWLDLYYLIAMNLHQSGMVKDAVRLLEQVVKIQEQTLAEDHPDRLASQHALAIAYRSNGQTTDAVRLLEQVVKIQEQTLAKDHPDRLASQHALAIAYMSNGQTIDAVRLLEQVVKIQEQTLAKDHPDRLSSEHALTCSLWATGATGTAIDMLRGVVNIQRISLDENHPNRTSSQEWLEYFEAEMQIDK